MLTTVDKAIGGAIVSFIANESVAYLHINIPTDVQTALAALIVAGMIWLIPNKVAS